MTSNINVVDSFRAALLDRESKTDTVSFQYGDAKVRPVGDDVIMTIGDDEFKLSDNAFRQLAGTLEIPIPFAKKIDDQLFDYNFNYLLAHNKEEFKNALVIDDRVRSFADPGNPYVSSNRVFETLAETFDGDFDLKYIKLDDTKMTFSMLPHQYKESIDGSNLFGGLKVAYSDAWAIFPSIDAYIWRELCTNGMIDKLDGHKFRVSGKTEDQILSQITSYAQLSLEKIPTLFANFEKLLEEKVDDYKKMIARICVEYKLPNKVRERLLFWAEQIEFLMTISGQKIENMHDIVNLITWTGSHDAELSQENRNLLLEIGGSLTLKHDERCGSCGFVL